MEYILEKNPEFEMSAYSRITLSLKAILGRFDDENQLIQMNVFTFFQ